MEQSINLLEFSRRPNGKAPANPRPFSSPPLLEGQASKGASSNGGFGDGAEKQENETNKAEVKVELHNISENKTISTEGSLAQETSLSVLASKPRSLTVEANSASDGQVVEDSGLPMGVARVGTVKEYHLHHMHSQPSQDGNQ